MKKKILTSFIALVLLGILALLIYTTYYNRIRNTYINPQRVEYITQLGGIAGTKWTVLNYKSDYKKIEKVITTINSNTNRHKASEEDLKFLPYRRGYPSFIHIKMKNGDEINVIKVYNIEILEDGHIATIDEEKVLLNFVRNTRENYYIIESKELVNYIQEGVYYDIPRVENQ